MAEGPLTTTNAVVAAVCGPSSLLSLHQRLGGEQVQTNDDVAVDGCHTLRLTFELIDDLCTDVGCAEVVLVAHDKAEVLVERLERDGSIADFLEEGDEAVLLDAVLVATTLLGELSVLVDAGST